MVLDLEMVKIDIQNKLQAMKLAHLQTRTQSRSVIIYSTDRGGEVIRAILIGLDSGEFVLGLANGSQWQLAPVVGPLHEMLELMVEACCCCTQ